MKLKKFKEINEVARITQTNVNNQYPQSLVERIIQNVVDKFTNPRSNASENIEEIPFFVEFNDIASFSTDQKQLKQIMSEQPLSSIKQ